MFTKHAFKADTSKEEMVEAIKKEGFNPILIREDANYVYEEHQHAETKLIVCVQGSMKVKVRAQEFDFEPGDKLIIPGNTLHSAVCSADGCTYYWSEKIMY
jgi:mannose-6-phosphate isomerase-like protein (cupin superfamily)